jgi:hypothetical protein
MKDAEYFAHPALGSTSIKTMATSTPRAYWAKHVDPDREPFVPTDAMRQGSLVDCLITCPEEFDEKYVLTPVDAPKRPTSTQLTAKKPSEATIEAIQFWHDFDAEIGDREVISLDWLRNAERIVDVLSKDAKIGPILKMERQSQVPHFWIDPVHGLQCKYKPDLEPEDGSLLDLKKGASANPRWFSKQAYSLGYDVQIDHYGKGYEDQHGKPPTRHGFIVYEWKWPHESALVIATEDDLAVGHDRRNEALNLIVKCQADNDWPSYGEAELNLPYYAQGAAADDDTNLDDLGLEGLE